MKLPRVARLLLFLVVCAAPAAALPLELQHRHSLDGPGLERSSKVLRGKVKRNRVFPVIRNQVLPALSGGAMVASWLRTVDQPPVTLRTIREGSDLGPLKPRGAPGWVTLKHRRLKKKAGLLWKTRTFVLQKKAGLRTADSPT